MFSKELSIFKSFLLLLITNVSDSVLFQLENDNIESANLLKAWRTKVVKNTDKWKENNHINNIYYERHPIENGFIKKDVSDFANKIFVKRILPHGYKVNTYEYDDKFKTLYKPLVRIHKRKADAEHISSNKDRNKYDMIYMLDDKYKDNTKLGNDEELFKPFAIDNMDIRYLPDNRNTLSNFGIGDHILQLNNYKIPISKKENRYEISKNRELIDSLKKLPKPKKDIRLSKSYSAELNSSESNKVQWFGTMGQLVSKHFRISKDNALDKKIKRNVSIYSLPRKNVIIYPTKLQKPLNEELSNALSKTRSIRNLNQWYVPMGQLISKVINRKERLLDNFGRSNENIQSKSKTSLTSDKYNLPSLIFKINERQTKNKDSLPNIRIKHNNKNQDSKETYELPKWFGPIGGRKPKQNDLSPRLESKWNKYKLFNEIAQLRQTNMNKDNMKLTDEIKGSENELRMIHLKSGEDPDADPMSSATVWIYDDPTTPEPTKAYPSYPFYNYWTYEKTIHQDQCPGQSVLLGNVCVRTPH